MTTDNAKRDAIRELTNDGAHPIEDWTLDDVDHDILHEAADWTLREPTKGDMAYYEHYSGLRLVIQDAGVDEAELPRLDDPSTSYAESGGTICRFASEDDRDQWVQAAPDLREPVSSRREANEDVDVLETLVDHELARWRDVHDPDADVTYAIADSVIPAQVSDLPVGQARAYWLCDHEDGPQVSQKEAAWLMQMSEGNIWTHLDRARSKLDPDPGAD